MVGRCVNVTGMFGRKLHNSNLEGSVSIQQAHNSTLIYTIQFNSGDLEGVYDNPIELGKPEWNQRVVYSPHVVRLSLHVVA